MFDSEKIDIWNGWRGVLIYWIEDKLSVQVYFQDVNNERKEAVSISVEPSQISIRKYSPVFKGHSYDIHQEEENIDLVVGEVFIQVDKNESEQISSWLNG
ncbi:hypothetical protein BUE93_22105 [Chromobacterium amazonense]|uniref:Uncharacterized protein n=2 Tax=Chromobacterium amazonense TaxID=1382803 RepID=A0A2S9WYM6_9NEIS|nr:hypothetical protein BUE93_22105 [Chromobacterium amazonense]